MRYADDFCAVCGGVVKEALDGFQPSCLAPVFSPSSGWACFFTRLVLAFVLFGVSFASWHPAVGCTYRRLLFRLQRCHVGNADACLDLDGAWPAPVGHAKVFPQPWA